MYFRAAITVLSALLCVSCASTHPDSPERGAPVSVPDFPVGADRFAEQRARVDFDGRSARCGEVTVGLERPQWLTAWCAFRTHDWRLVAHAAEEALPSFQTRGRLRRQVELHLLRAIALTRLGDPEADDVLERAQILMGRSRMPIHGPLGDRYAGDLAYLLARARRAGLSIAAHDVKLPSTARLLDTAWFEYETSHFSNALPHVARSRTLVALDDGDVDAALAWVARALRIERDARNEAGMRATLRTVSTLGRTIGDPDLAMAADEQTVIYLDEQVLPAANVAFGGVDELLETAVGRRKLTAKIEALRASAEGAIRPPVGLLTTLRSADDLSHLEGTDWRFAHQAALLLREAGVPEASRRYLERSVDNIEALRASISDPEMRQRFFVGKRDVYLALVDAYVGIDTADRAQTDLRRGFRLANAIKARGLLDLLEGLAVTPPNSRPRVDAGEGIQGDAERVSARLKRAMKWRRPPTDTPDFRGLTEWASDNLPDDAVLVEYAVGKNRSWVWVLADGRFQMRRLSGRDVLLPLVTEFQSALLTRDPTLRQRRRREMLSERLYVELIGPIRDLVADAELLVVAPDASLRSLPFEALVRPVRDRSNHYLIHDHAVTYVPSTAALRRLEERDRKSTGDRALFFGDPSLDRPALGLLPIADEIPNAGMMPLDDIFPPLPGARHEVRRLSGLLHDDADVFVGGRATEGKLRRSDLGDYGLLHFAVHGISDAPTMRRSGFSTTEPALLLARDPDEPDDGVLTLREILDYRLSARTVVLSACETGNGWRTLGDGAYGLAGAFLYAGARSVVASTWSISDRQTVPLMKAMYRSLSRGRSPAHALRRAQLAVLSSPGAEPADWAGFRAIGL